MLKYKVKKGRIKVEELFKKFFEKEKIEYYTVLDYRELCETSPEIMKREELTPRSVILYLLPYYGGECVNISRYAAARDYHIKIREVNSALSRLVCERFPEAKVKGYGDRSPIDERDAAVKGGLGILGENGLLINESYGSYVFIADLVTDIAPELIGARKPEKYSYCKACGACKKVCPTGVLRGGGCECLSSITQKKGELTEEEISLMKKYDTVWGCDLCQSVCPYNISPRMTPIDFFLEERIDELNFDVLESLDKKSFEERAFSWRGRRTVMRNVKIIK